MYSCHLFLISSAHRAHLCMKCFLGMSNLLEEISSLSHSVVFLRFFGLITEEGFLICPCYSLELYCFFVDPADVNNLISGSPAFLKTSLNIWKFMVHILLKPGLENFKHYFTSLGIFQQFWKILTHHFFKYCFFLIPLSLLPDNVICLLLSQYLSYFSTSLFPDFCILILHSS